jgi:glycosyltransferase involved in cell wall biosynthesis
MLDIGIVVASHNTRGLLRTCLQSVYSSQGSVDFSVCIVDDASSDGSAEMVAREFPQARLITNSENLGYAQTSNRGLVAYGFGDVPDWPTEVPTPTRSFHRTRWRSFSGLPMRTRTSGSQARRWCAPMVP